MKIIRGIYQLPPDHAGCVATIGNFDGVHRGHQQVLAHLKDCAKTYQLPATVISFEPLPHEFFMGDTAAPRIYPWRDKVRLLQYCNIEHFIQLTFNKDFSQIEADDFVMQLLLKTLQVRYLVVGDDFRFGKMRQGNFQRLCELGQQHNMTVQDTKTVLAEQQRISSTRIRAELQAGNLHAANELLGYPYQLSGRIRQGDQLGRTLDFPTVNLQLPENIALRCGIYAVKVHGLNNTIYYGAASVGKRPTVDGVDMRLETYIFDFQEYVYGQYIRVEPLHFIRPEEKFSSLDVMQQQIYHDCDVIKTWIQQNEI